MNSKRSCTRPGHSGRTFVTPQIAEQLGPNLGRPNVDTLDDSSFPNIKELRFRLDGLWRFVFAFDTKRQAVVLVGGDKVGENVFTAN
ncbi:MAG: type II toxin-antitoxin system RelE/ParE family toxin [Bradyrhizobium sp.]|jgi:hypothetical protein